MRSAQTAFSGNVLWRPSCARGDCAGLIVNIMKWPDACSPAPRMATEQSLSIREGSQGEGMPCASRNAILTEYSRPRISLFCILFSPALAAYARIRFFFDPPARASARIAFDSRRLLRAFVVCVPRPWCGPGKRWPTGPTRAASSPKPSSMCSPEGVAQVVRAA